MKTVLKRLLSFVLVAMMVVSVLPFQASALDETETTGNVTLAVVEKVGDASEKVFDGPKTITFGNYTADDVIALYNVPKGATSVKAFYSVDNRQTWIEMNNAEKGAYIDANSTSIQLKITYTLPQTAFNVIYEVVFKDADDTLVGSTYSYKSGEAVTAETYDIDTVVKAAKANTTTPAAPEYSFGTPTAKAILNDDNNSTPVAVAQGGTVAGNAKVTITVPVTKEYTVTLYDEKDPEYASGKAYDVMYTTNHVFKDEPKGTPEHDDWKFDRWDSRKIGDNYGDDLDDLWGDTLTGNLVYYARYKESTSENADGLSDIKIIAKYYVDGVEKKEATLFTIDDQKDGKSLYDMMYSSSNVNAVSDAIKKLGWTDAHWIDGKFYENSVGSEEIDSYDELDGDRTVYVMVGKKGAVKVQLYVHTSYKEEPTYIVNVFGFEAGDTVYKADIKEVMEEKWPNRTYSFNGLYDDNDWIDILAGKDNVTRSTSFEITTERTDKGVVNIHIHATLVSSSASSNPKTGDTILMAGSALGVSALALAVLYFLNKKKQVM